jgi:hypothetical protein
MIPIPLELQCRAEAPESGTHRGTHICRTAEPHDKHRCAVCGFGWPVNTATCEVRPR